MADFPLRNTVVPAHQRLEELGGLAALVVCCAQADILLRRDNLESDVPPRRLVNDIHRLGETDGLPCGQEDDLVLVATLEHQSGVCLAEFLSQGESAASVGGDGHGGGVRIPVDKQRECIGVDSFANRGECESRPGMVSELYI